MIWIYCDGYRMKKDIVWKTIMQVEVLNSSILN